MSTDKDPENVPGMPMRTRFLMYRGEPRALTNDVRKVSGTHKAFRILFSTEGREEVLSESEWKRALMRGDVRPLGAGDAVAELFSDAIGDPSEEIKRTIGAEGLTPPQALRGLLARYKLRSEQEREEVAA